MDLADINFSDFNLVIGMNVAINLISVSTIFSEK